MGDTSFVQVVHKSCPGVYGYAYDDAMGLLRCNATSRYQLTFYCPSPMIRIRPGERPLPLWVIVLALAMPMILLGGALAGVALWRQGWRLGYERLPALEVPFGPDRFRSCMGDLHESLQSGVAELWWHLRQGRDLDM